MKGFIWLLNIVMLAGLCVFFYVISTEKQIKYKEHEPDSDAKVTEQVTSLEDIGSFPQINNIANYNDIVDENVFSKDRQPPDTPTPTPTPTETPDPENKDKTPTPVQEPQDIRDLRYVTHFYNEDPPTAYFEKKRDDGYDSLEIITVKKGDFIRGWLVRDIFVNEVVIKGNEWVRIFGPIAPANGVQEKEIAYDERRQKILSGELTPTPSSIKPTPYVPPKRYTPTPYPKKGEPPKTPAKPKTPYKRRTPPTNPFTRGR